MNKQSNEEIRNSIIGLGEKSVRKSYYPLLQKKIKEIEQLNENLENNVNERTKELIEQKNIFESLFYDSSDALALMKNGKYIDCNNSLLKLLGYEDKKSFLNIRPHEISPTFQIDGTTSVKKELEMIEKCIKEGKNSFEWIHKRLDGELFWVDVSLTKIVLNNEIHIHVAWRDISDKKALAKQLERSNEELQESNDELNATINNLKKMQKQIIESAKMASLADLIVGISNEINKPSDVAVTGITYLIHTIEEMKEKLLSKELKEDEILSYLNSSEDLSKLINTNLEKISSSINKFKQISTNQKNEKERSINIKNYLNGIILGLKDILSLKQIDINILCNEELNINSYPNDFTLIFTNLITNTIEHAFKDMHSGEINIKINIKDGILIITYENSGEQIKKEHLSKIFEPFFTTSEKNENSGLGLNIVYNIINNKLKGTITCKNKEDKGVKFDIRIPVSMSQNNIIYHI